MSGLQSGCQRIIRHTIHKHCSHSWIPAFAHTSRPALASAAVLMPSLRSLGHSSGFAALRPSRQKPLARFARPATIPRARATETGQKAISTSIKSSGFGAPRGVHSIRSGCKAVWERGVPVEFYHLYSPKHTHAATRERLCFVHRNYFRRFQIACAAADVFPDPAEGGGTLGQPLFLLPWRGQPKGRCAL